ncbi:MAG: peptidoglycan-binding protein, partial [Proteobacteria bacterium]|nr:peptidoglycan-binding protein [Pseudomonadota bacterium]
MRDKIDKFSWAMEFVLGQEGGYSNDPRDPGGETNFGIAKKFHPNVDIKALTAGQAKMIYFGQYWRPARCPDMPAPVALAVMDMAVNCGSAKAAVR